MLNLKALKSNFNLKNSGIFLKLKVPKTINCIFKSLHIDKIMKEPKKWQQHPVFPGGHPSKY